MTLRREHVGRLCLSCFVLFAAAFTSLCAGELPNGAETIEPSVTKVLLLRPIDATVDSRRLAPLRQQIIRLRQQVEFLGRHFVVLGEAAAAKASATDRRLKMERVDERTAPLMDELAGRVGADWIVGIAVEEIASDSADASDGSKTSVHSRLAVQIRDARRHVWLSKGNYVGRVAGGASPPELFIECLDKATGEALDAVLRPYPQIVPVSRDGSIVDYLVGETAPVLGEPGKVFTGSTQKLERDQAR